MGRPPTEQTWSLLRELADRGLFTEEEAKNIVDRHSQSVDIIAPSGAKEKKQGAVVVPDFTYRLDYTGGPGIIGRLAESGSFRGYRNPDINDKNFPVTGSGIVDVRFKVVPGEELISADERVWQNEAEKKFSQMGMRFPNAAEGLLPFAENHQLGRKRPVVVFIKGTSHAFFVGGSDRGRCLDLYSGDDDWRPGFDFLGVCE